MGILLARGAVPDAADEGGVANAGGARVPA
jgi:hypothetical protein